MTTRTSSAARARSASRSLRTEPDLDASWCRSAAAGSSPASPSRSRRSTPKTAVIGVETELYPSLWAALRGRRQPMRRRLARRGHRGQERRQAHLRDRAARSSTTWCSFPESAIERAVAAYLTLQKTMAEGAGAAGLAALLADPDRFRGKPRRPDPCRRQHRSAARRLDHGARARPRANGSSRFRLFISDRPGVLGDIAATIGEKGGNILEVLHHRTMLSVPPKGASIDVTIETHGARACRRDHRRPHRQGLPGRAARPARAGATDRHPALYPRAS